jgi:hypothetical protein
LCEISLMCIQLGYKETALILVLMFSAYFRPGEVFTILADQVSPPVNQFIFTAINLFPSGHSARSKIGMGDESLLLDSVFAPWLGPMISTLAKRRAGGTLFRTTYIQVRQAFEMAQTRLGLKEFFILYQIRHGGPSYDWAMQFRGFAAIKERGRWATDQSVNRYKAAARLQQIEAHLPVALRRMLPSAPSRLEVQLHSLSRDISEAGPQTMDLANVESSNCAVVQGRGRKRLRSKASPLTFGTSGTTHAETSAVPLMSMSSLNNYNKVSTNTYMSGFRSTLGLRRAG